MLEIEALARDVITLSGDPQGRMKGLDYGCNDGAVQAFFQDLDPRFDMSGADVNPYAVMRASQKHRHAVVIRSGSITRLESASFDFVICLATLAHIPDQAAALAEMHRLLKPNGFLIVETPNPKFDRVNAVSHLLTGYKGDPTIVRKVSPDRLRSMTAETFDFLRLEHTGRRLPGPLSLIPLTSDYRMTMVKK
jgi:ubiquinone/menaquinone biosynthesis C-methylase UbiE